MPTACYEGNPRRSAGEETEWVKAYTDFAGRAYKAVYPTALPPFGSTTPRPALEIRRPTRRHALRLQRPRRTDGRGRRPEPQRRDRLRWHRPYQPHTRSVVTAHGTPSSASHRSLGRRQLDSPTTVSTSTPQPMAAALGRRRRPDVQHCRRLSGQPDGTHTETTTPPTIQGPCGPSPMAG